MQRHNVFNEKEEVGLHTEYPIATMSEQNKRPTIEHGSMNVQTKNL